ncbi:hypothetical protein CASFOL_001161 [Castilleja foliolosa]|uniref:Uncharacterized protein n=1 Tax=Castilleja foliolosa TaxID=1961234 RepID=A0ABD3EQM6_9LAMI
MAHYALYQRKNISFHENPWPSRSSLDLKIASLWSRPRPMFCMSVQQASKHKVVGPQTPGETCHIVIDHGSNVPYWEGVGQSYGIIPPR